DAKKKAKEAAAAKKGAGADGGADGKDGGGGGAGAGEAIVPAFDKQDQKTYAKALADLDVVPVSKTVFSDFPAGTVVGTRPAPGTKVKAKSKVLVQVSQ